MCHVVFTDMITATYYSNIYTIHYTVTSNVQMFPLKYIQFLSCRKHTDFSEPGKKLPILQSVKSKTLPTKQYGS